MYQIDFHKPLSIHFIGIGGISMSGLAEILLEEGFTISGSDSKKKPSDQYSHILAKEPFYTGTILKFLKQSPSSC